MRPAADPVVKLSTTFSQSTEVILLSSTDQSDSTRSTVPTNEMSERSMSAGIERGYCSPGIPTMSPVNAGWHTGRFATRLKSERACCRNGSGTLCERTLRTSADTATSSPFLDQSVAMSLESPALGPKIKIIETAMPFVSIMLVDPSVNRDIPHRRRREKHLATLNVFMDGGEKCSRY